MKSSIVAAFEACEVTSSRTDKLEILKSVMRSDAATKEQLRQIFDFTFDTFKTYRIVLDPKKFQGSSEPSSQFSGLEDVHYAAFATLLASLAASELTGSRALQAVSDLLEKVPAATAKWYVRIINRDLKCGVAQGTINALFPGLVKDFPIQLATSIDDGTFNITKIIEGYGGSAFVNAKLDGYRGLVIPKDGRVASRGGKDLYNCDAVLNELAAFPEYVFDGEFLAGDGPGEWGITSTIVKSSKSKVAPEIVQKLRFYVFDIIPYDDFMNRRIPSMLQRERSELLQRLLPEWKIASVVHVPSVEVTSEDGLDEAHESFLEQGFEGTVIKNPFGKYAYDRTADWLKHKPVIDEDFVVVGASLGTGKNSTVLGKMTVRNSVGLEFECGGGLTDKARKEFWDIHEAGELLGKVIEIRYDPNPKIKGRFSRFLRLRDDKTSKDVLGEWYYGEKDLNYVPAYEESAGE